MKLRPPRLPSSEARVRFTLLATALIWTAPMGYKVDARQTPVPRTVASPALRTKANTQVSSIRTGAGQYDQAIAAIARLATAPVSSQAQVKALITTLDTNLKTVRERVNDRLLLIALSDVTFKQSVEAAVRQQGGKALLADVRTRGIDRISGVSGVQAALTRRLQEDAQTLTRTGEALAGKSRQASNAPHSTLGTGIAAALAPACEEIAPPVAAAPGHGAGEAPDTTQRPIPPHTSFDLTAIVVSAAQLFAIIADKGENPPDDTPPPLPPASSLERCFNDVNTATIRCLSDAGLNPLKILDCAAKRIAGVATCLTGR